MAAAVAVGLIAAAPVASAQAASVWHDAVTVASAVTVAPAFQVRGDDAVAAPVPGGGWLTAWLQADGAMAGDVSAGGAFARPVLIDASAGTTPDLGVDASGEALLAWAGPDGVRFATRPSRGAWGAPEVLAPVAQLQWPVVAMNAKGDALVAWRERAGPEGPYFVRAAMRPAGGAFGPVETLATATRRSPVDAPRATIAPDGTALVAWVRYLGGSKGEVALRPPGGAWQALGALTTNSPSVAFDGTSTASTIWIDRATGNLSAIDRPAGGVFGPPTSVGVPIPATRSVIAGRPAGGFVLAWAAGTAVRTAERDGGVLGPIADTGAIIADYSTLALAVGPSGQAVIASSDWTPGQGQVQATLRDPDGTVSAAERLSDTGENEVTVLADAVGSTGNALVLWTRYYPTQAVLRAAVHSDNAASATPPPGVPQGAPPTPPKPKPLTMKLTVPTRPKLGARGRLKLKVRCSIPCEISADTSYVLPGHSKRQLRAPHALAHDRGRGATLTITPNRSTLAKLRRALKSAKRVTARIVITGATQTKHVTKRVRITLRR